MRNVASGACIVQATTNRAGSKTWADFLARNAERRRGERKTKQLNSGGIDRRYVSEVDKDRFVRGQRFRRFESVHRENHG